MKKVKNVLIAALLLFTVLLCHAQNADEIIDKYLKAIGGKEFIGNLKSVYIESMADVQGMQLPQKVTILNGVGYKSEFDVMGSLLVNCFTEKGGWTINPFAGVSTAEDMPENQFKEGKDQIYIGAPFSVYKEKGYKAEYVGNEDVRGINAAKIKMTSPDSIILYHWFDPQTGYLVKSMQQSQMEGQPVEVTVLYDDYRDNGGYKVPYKVYTSIGYMMEINSTVSKVELNKPVDPSVFIKP
ncbi:MAG: hypothetical protein WBJ37_10685 [Bacteroidales bacterium]